MPDPWDDAMRSGDFARALALHDAALAARLAGGAVRDDPRLPYHRRWVWDGTPPDGRDVLVRCYHGLGDALQFARFLPMLRGRARSVTLEAPAALAALLARGGVLADRVVAFREDAPLPPSACDVECMELAHVLRALPPPPPLLPHPPAAPPGGEGGGARVGFCWRAGGWDPARDVPFAGIEPLLAVSGLHALSLQRGGEQDARFLNPEGAPSDVAETAALVAGLHLVVSVDTMVAHLAGALGVPCLVLLRGHADWRWMRGGRTAWYPRARLLRQEREGAWGPVLARAAAELRALVKPKSSFSEEKEAKRF